MKEMKGKHDVEGRHSNLEIPIDQREIVRGNKDAHRECSEPNMDIPTFDINFNRDELINWIKTMENYLKQKRLGL